MKKLLFTVLLATGLLLPASFTATVNNTASKTEVSSKNKRKNLKRTKAAPAPKDQNPIHRTKDVLIMEINSTLVQEEGAIIIQEAVNNM